MLKKKNEINNLNEEENLNTFIALGGNSDKTGKILVEDLIKSIKIILTNTLDEDKYLKKLFIIES